MLQNLNITFLLFLLIMLLGCSSNKKEIVLEDETPESLLQKATAEFENGNFEESIKINRMLLTHFPTSDMHIDAQLNIAQSLGASEKFEEQFDLLVRILKENIIPEKVPQIYMQIGEFYEHAAKWNPGDVTGDSTDIEKAAIYYRKAVFYPNSDDKTVKSAALYRTALMYAKLKKIDTAVKAYEQVIAFYPESQYSELAKIKLRNPSNTNEITLTTEQEEEIEKAQETQLEKEILDKPETEITGDQQLVSPEDSVGISSEEESLIDESMAPDTTQFFIPDSI